MSMTSSPVLSVGRGWIAIDKPAGMTVHNDPGQDALAFAESLLQQDEDLARACSWMPGESLSPAHRLDRETSGVLLLATSRESASRLQAAFGSEGEASTAQTKKTYRAILRGALSGGAGFKGTWSFAVSDRAEGRVNPAGKAPDRKESRTAFVITRANPFLTEIEVDLITGRQHQIRKHAALAKHNVVGDGRYGDPKHARMIESKFGCDRLMLHAQTLELKISGETVVISSPLPHEFDLLFAPLAPRAGERDQ